MRFTQKGNIFLTLLIFALFAGAIFGIYKLSLDALPGQMLYPLKEEIESVRLATTELSKVQRALIYIEFANERLDEVEKLVEKKENPDNIIPVLENLLMNEQLAVEVMKKETAKIEDERQVILKFKELRERQEVIFDRILDSTPDPHFYTVLDIKNKAMEVLDEYNFR